ncbi:NIPSNAP family protein [Pseudoroseomonas rhizosphaerae]|uniref:NIPSNAP family protein n=1 Tax=Teichococcus rhizosphaerae TaxID=1335062 RepID=A0A2C7AGT1_9PROT|nr:NIPSNAP family protein [Pseudoroseomonas rhizosphaerae]PHK96913.1 NIPSNAP family protein [Pseudoroseomonas rhizosphaerae]
MLLDHRTYICRPGTIRKQLALYQEYGLAAQTRHLGMPVAYLTTETGDVNCYVHVWAYEDAADRERRRAAMQADPEWIEFLRRSAEAGYLVSQNNSLMRPVDFLPQPVRAGG